MNNNNMNEINDYLFGQDYFNDSVFTYEISEECEETAKNEISKFGWDAVYSSWFDYLTNHCKTPHQVCNFAHLFWLYGGQEHQIDNIYEFIGYLYYRLNLEPAKYETLYNARTIMDSIANDLQEKAGFKKDIWMDDDYVPEKDPVIIQAVDEWRKKLG